MRKNIMNILFFMVVIVIITGIKSLSMTVWAWGDNDGGRPSYTEEEINDGAIGATEISDGENYKESDNYPGIIVFNSISDSAIGNEKNFVGTRECTIQANGRCDADHHGESGTGRKPFHQRKRDMGQAAVNGGRQIFACL